MYKSCHLCPRGCGVNREAGQTGRCGMTDQTVLARAALHFWEEPCISGTRGSGTVFFCGCPLGCIYCQNREIALAHYGKAVTPARLTEIFLELEGQGAHNINLVTATHYAPTVAQAIRAARALGLTVPIVYNTSGYETPETLALLDGLIDIYLTDYRYATSRLAGTYSGAPDYPAVARRAIAEMVRQTGAPVYDGEGIMQRGTVARILLLPDATGDAKRRVRELYAHYGEGIVYSLMSQYTPRSDLPAPLSRKVHPAEYDRLVAYATALGVQNAYVQEGTSATESFIPPFDTTGV